MNNGFPWYVIHKETKFVVAGFVEASDAHAFCDLFSHGMYVARDAITVRALHGA